MNAHYYYLLVDVLCISIPFFASFHPKLKFYKTWPALFPSIVLVASAFLLWDEWFTKMGVWGFNPDYLLGVYFGHLPLEELLFFVCIPYACVFTYHCIKILWNNPPLQQASKSVSTFLITLSTYFVLFFSDRLYTFVTFLSLLISLVFYWIFRKNKYFGSIFFSYLVITPFFLISNGILTGTGIEHEIVWYNDMENIGKRIGTIPFEDFFYGFLLIFLITALYEWLLNKFFNATT